MPHVCPGVLKTERIASDVILVCVEEVDRAEKLRNLATDEAWNIYISQMNEHVECIPTTFSTNGRERLRNKRSRGQEPNVYLTGSGPMHRKGREWKSKEGEGQRRKLLK